MTTKRHIQVYLIDAGVYLDVLPDSLFPLVLDASLAEIYDINSRKRTGSKTFRISATPSNNKTLKQFWVAGTYIGDLTALILKTDAYIMVDGIVFEKGYIRLRNANINNNRPDYYEAVFFGESVKWVDNLTSTIMADIDIITLDYTDTNIKSKMQTPGEYTFVTPYLWKWKDASTYNITGDDLWPALRLDKLLEGMFDAAGINYSSTFIDDAFTEEIYYSIRNTENVNLGDTSVSIGDFFDDTPIIDVFMDIVKMFNLMVYPVGNVLYIEPRENWEDWASSSNSGHYTGTVIDWSEKMESSYTIDISPSYTRYIEFRYAEDSSDLSLSVAREIAQKKGQYSALYKYWDGEIFEIIDLLEDKTQKIELKRICPTSFSDFDYSNPTHTRDDQENVWSHRLALYSWVSAGTYVPAGYYGGGLTYENSDTSTTALSGYGYYDMGALRNNSVFSDKNVSFSTYSTQTGIYERFQEKTIDKIKYGRMLIGQFNLTIKDFMAFDWTSYVSINNQLYIVDKIHEFHPHEPGLTKISLIKLD